MSRSSIARHAALVIATVAGVCGLSSTAAGQRRAPRSPPPAPSQARPRFAFGPTPTRPTPPATPYPGATVTDRRFYGQRFPGSVRGRRNGAGRGGGFPIDGYGYAYGYDGVAGYDVYDPYDMYGRPLRSGYDPAAPQAAPQSDFPMGTTPDLSGSPYVVIDGGTMVVNFGNGDRRAVPSCGSVEKASTPEGQPRTIFYRPPAYSLVLRAGQRGQVLGRPAAGARVCYTLDSLGRIALAY
jgi:hypothetical protein